MVAGKSDGTGNMGQYCYGMMGRAVDRIGVLLRCVVVGFLTLFVWVVSADGGGGGSIWVALAGAMVCGLLIYSLHVCVLARIIWRPLILRSHLGKEDHPWIGKDQRKLADVGMDRLLLELSVSRLRRRISEAAEARSVQKGLDRWRGMVSFLYCAGYAMIVVPLVVMSPKSEAEASTLVWYVIIFGAVALIAAMISDNIETWHELWAGATYKDAKAATATRPRKRSR